MTLRIILADDHAVVRMGFRMLLEAGGKITVVGEAPSGEALLELLRTVQADVIVLDLSMPGMGGLEAIKRLLAHAPEQKVVVLSAHEDLSHPRRSLAAGARGYVTKRSAADVLSQAIEQVAAGHVFIEPALAQQLAASALTGTVNPVESLSKREFEVFIKLEHGASVNEIAADLNVSPRTIGTHHYNIKQKLAAENASELTLIALSNGLLRV